MALLQENSLFHWIESEINWSKGDVWEITLSRSIKVCHVKQKLVTRPPLEIVQGYEMN